MKINIAPNIDQIRFFAKSALHAWDVLPPDVARENIIADMTALLRYLDACDSGDGVVVVGISKIERGLRLEVSRRDHKVFDLTDRYAGDSDIADHPGELQGAAPVDVQDMRSHGDSIAADPEVDLATLGEGNL
jgi:hypothetical protein